MINFMLDFYDGKKLNGLNKLGNYTSLNIVRGDGKLTSKSSNEKD